MYFMHLISSKVLYIYFAFVHIKNLNKFLFPNLKNK